MHFQSSFPKYEAKLEANARFQPWIALNRYNNKHPLTSNAEGYGGKTH
jgi:hypothetical protein